MLCVLLCGVLQWNEKTHHIYTFVLHNNYVDISLRPLYHRTATLYYLAVDVLYYVCIIFELVLLSCKSMCDGAAVE